MSDKYIKLADVKRKLRYIFKAYGVGGFVREKVERTLNNLPYSVKGDLETTLKAADVQPVKHGRWIWDSNAPHREHGAYKCSNCGCHSDFEENYCYNCGARMDGDSE